MVSTAGRILSRLRRAEVGVKIHIPIDSLPGGSCGDAKRYQARILRRLGEPAATGSASGFRTGSGTDLPPA
jgi:hypothetical protein